MGKNCTKMSFKRISSVGPSVTAPVSTKFQAVQRECMESSVAEHCWYNRERERERERERARLLASVAGSSGPSVLNFVVNFISWNRWIQSSLSGKDG